MTEQDAIHTTPARVLLATLVAACLAVAVATTVLAAACSTGDGAGVASGSSSAASSRSPGPSVAEPVGVAGPSATTAADPDSLDLGLPTPAPGPAIVALEPVDVLRDEPVRIRYRVKSPVTGSARVTIVVERPDGTVVARVARDEPQPCGRTFTCTLPRRLPPGSYRYTVYAVDEDGRHQTKIESRPLVVRDVVPRPADLKRAVAWLQKRRGSVGFAVVDSEGKLHGWHQDQPFVTASVVKAMLLVAYLRSHRDGPGYMSPTLTSMIEISDNNAASAVHGAVGDAGLYAVARAADMKHFAGCGYWSGAQITAADQARFFARIFDLVPAGERDYARHLLSHIASYQSWGIPAAARHHGWTVYFKGGWRGTERGQLVHQVARLEKGGQIVTIAVMTDGDSSMGYGIETIRGAAERLLGVR